MSPTAQQSDLSEGPVSGIQSWSELSEKRAEIKRLFPRVWDIPLVKKEMGRLMVHTKPGSRILEVGAGDRRFEKKIKKAVSPVVYKSMDIDRKTGQDYYSLDEIREPFDFIFMFEVIEHLSPGEALVILGQIRALLRPGGTLLLSTPNLFHPNRYFQDVTHKTPFRYEDLGAVMRMAHFGHIRFFRMHNEAFLQRLFRRCVGVHLHKYLELDFAKTLLAEGERI